MARKRIYVKSSLIGSSDIQRVKQAETCRKYNHNHFSFISIGQKVKVEADLEVKEVRQTVVTRKNRPISSEVLVTLWGGIKVRVPLDVALKSGMNYTE